MALAGFVFGLLFFTIVVLLDYPIKHPTLRLRRIVRGAVYYAACPKFNNETFVLVKLMNHWRNREGVQIGRIKQDGYYYSVPVITEKWWEVEKANEIYRESIEHVKRFAEEHPFIKEVLIE